MTRRRRARAVSVLAVLVAGSLWVVVPAAPASAATSLTVTPSTGLVDGQFVEVTGDGWGAHAQIAVCEAVPVAPAGIGDCSNGFVVEIPADASGHLDFPFTVGRIFTPPVLGHAVDCTDPATPCVIAAADGSNVAGTVATAALNFAPPPPPRVVPDQVSIPEGNSGTKTLNVPVSLQNPDLQTVTVQWNTEFVAGAPMHQADPATDYTPAHGTLTFAPGDVNERVQVTINGDVLIEPDEYIVVTFHDATNATIGGFYGLGFGGITNDDHPVVVPGTASVDEGNSGTTELDVPVTLAGTGPQTVTVHWNTEFVTGAPANQADPATDYTPASGTVTFAPGESAKTVAISLKGDTLVEPDEYIVVLFHDPTNATLGGFYGLGFGGITNDDGP